MPRATTALARMTSFLATAMLALSDFFLWRAGLRRSLEVEFLASQKAAMKMLALAARPARTWRLPLRAPLSSSKGATPTRLAISSRLTSQFGAGGCQRQRGAQADALDGYEQVKPARQRGVPAERRG